MWNFAGDFGMLQVESLEVGSDRDSVELTDAIHGGSDDWDASPHEHLDVDPVFERRTVYDNAWNVVHC